MLLPFSGLIATTRQGLFALLVESLTTVKRIPSENAGDAPGILKLCSSTISPATSTLLSTLTCQDSGLVARRRPAALRGKALNASVMPLLPVTVTRSIGL